MIGPVEVIKGPQTHMGSLAVLQSGTQVSTKPIKSLSQESGIEGPQSGVRGGGSDVDPCLEGSGCSPSITWALSENLKSLPTPL